jgi:hypothetical protein
MRAAIAVLVVALSFIAFAIWSAMIFSRVSRQAFHRSLKGQTLSFAWDTGLPSELPG